MSEAVRQMLEKEVSSSKPQTFNQAYDRLLKGDVKYRFVIDMATLK